MTDNFKSSIHAGRCVQQRTLRTDAVAERADVAGIKRSGFAFYRAQMPMIDRLAQPIVRSPLGCRRPQPFCGAFG